MRCQDCGKTGFRRLFDDPSDPPLDVYPCLCVDCVMTHISDCIEDANSKITMLNDMKREVLKAGP